MKAMVLLILVALTAASQTGIRVGLTQQAIDNFNTKALPELFKKIGTISIPNQSQKIGVGFLAIKVELTDITLQNFSVNTQQSSLTLNSPDRLNLKVQDLAGELFFNWKYQYPIGSNYGTGTAKFSKSNLNAQNIIQVLQDRAQVIIPEIQASIGSLNIELKGFILAKIQDFIFQLFNGPLKLIIEDLLAGTVKNQIETSVNAFFKNLPLIKELPETEIAIDYQLTESIIVTDKFVQAGIMGLLINTRDPNSTPPISPPVPMQNFSPAGKGFQFMISDYTINSGFYSFYQLDYQLKITSFTVNNETAYFDTSNLGVFLPGLEEKYGQEVPCYFLCGLGSSPVLSSTITKGDQVGQANFTCGLNVENKGQAVLFDIGILFVLDFKLIDWNVSGKVRSFEIESIQALDNQIGQPIDDSMLKSALQIVVNVALPVINDQFLNHPIPLPQIPYVNLTETEVSVEEGYILAQATPIWDFN